MVYAHALLTTLTLQVHYRGHFHCVFPIPVGLTGAEDSGSGFWSSSQWTCFTYNPICQRGRL